MEFIEKMQLEIVGTVKQVTWFAALSLGGKIIKSPPLSLSPPALGEVEGTLRFLLN